MKRLKLKLNIKISNLVTKILFSSEKNNKRESPNKSSWGWGDSGIFSKKISGGPRLLGT